MITETDLVEQLMTHLDSISREEFLIEVNYILDANYTVEDIDWGLHSG